MANPDPEMFPDHGHGHGHGHISIASSINAGVGHLQGMGYGVFCNWINGKKKGSKHINARAMKGMEHFVNHWEVKKKIK